MKTTINKLLSTIILAVVMVSVSGCDNFDYSPEADNRTLYSVGEYTFNDNTLDNPELTCDREYRGWGKYFTLKEYYERYFQEMVLIRWDNGKYEVNVFVLNEDTEPTKPHKKNGKIQLKLNRYLFYEDYENVHRYFGTIQLTEVGHNRYDCVVYDADCDITFTVTVQFDEGCR